MDTRDMTKVYVKTAKVIGTLVSVQFVPQPQTRLGKAPDGTLIQVPTGGVSFTATAIVAHGDTWWVGPVGDTVHLEEAGFDLRNYETAQDAVDSLAGTFPPLVAKGRVPLL